MLQPKKTKFRKTHKGRIHGVAKGGTDLAFGQYALKATEPERVTARQIEAARRAITREMKRQGRVWIRIFPDVPVTKKPTEVRMGKGKGSVEFWAARKARSYCIRDRWRPRGRCQGSSASRRDEAPDHDAGCYPHCRLRTMIMKASDVRSKTADELKDQLVGLKKEQFNLRFQRATQQLEKPTEVKKVRRDIARIKTILAEKNAAK
tara:strand:- start:35918 stop:36535 length:618 start_codon:yes stop_codon:yes gene_type:complete